MRLFWIGPSEVPALCNTQGVEKLFHLEFRAASRVASAPDEKQCNFVR